MESAKEGWKWCFDSSNTNLKKCDFTNYAGNGYKWPIYIGKLKLSFTEE